MLNQQLDSVCFVFNDSFGVLSIIIMSIEALNLPLKSLNKISHEDHNTSNKIHKQKKKKKKKTAHNSLVTTGKGQTKLQFNMVLPSRTAQIHPSVTTEKIQGSRERLEFYGMQRIYCLVFYTIAYTVQLRT